MRKKNRAFITATAFAIGVAGIIAGNGVLAAGTCSVVASGLEAPLSLVQSNAGNFIVSESGTAAANSGRISIVDASGTRRTLVDGLPSGINDVGDPSGPAGLALRGRTLYVAIGVGDVGLIGRDAAGNPIPGSDVVNPDGPSSPIMSSVLAIHFSTDVERTASPFALTLADHEALASGRKLTLRNSAQGRIDIELVTNFENYVPLPHPLVANNVSLSNPFGLVALGDLLYVTDGGRNLVWEVDTATGDHTVLVTFPREANPLFPAVGGPMTDAVPTGIASAGGDLLVALFRGGPFAPGTSSVEAIDLLSGADTRFIAGLKTAIGILPIQDRSATRYLVLQNSSGPGPFFGGPGVLLEFAVPSAAPTVLADCLTQQPTAMTLDRKAGTLHVTQLDGSIVAIPLRH
jgi:hypothetical protein